ncbi:AraC family transcriptional regulator [Henriciella pelagia]|uniref:HTH araC/xylS-type domain-containing protein n=1 Tax=Henriciella pelagia TaxID=1977912 RepID=A0ABQ1JZ57_9PROT|nr:AraC family transcriptional regulator [Henriciella pelagia]GGB81367.1 hypothetical protein GCM10011503_32700 [Henriciella pelagia]
MAVPNIRVTELVAGLVQLVPGTRYEVPAPGVSAIYLPEDGPIMVQSGDRKAVQVEKGGLCSLPKGGMHTLHAPGHPLVRQGHLDPPFPIDPPHGDGPVIFAGRMPSVSNPLPDIVPDIIVLSRAEMRQERQLDLIFSLIRENALTPEEDRTQITHRLAEVAAIILLEYVLRSLKSDGLNAAAGVGDPHIRKALLAIHENPDEAWTLDRLASQAGLSRSVFAQRFREIVDQTPVDYLTRIRMARATRLLRANELSVSEIAFEVGYKSDASFHKAFKRMIGVSPNAYRKQKRKG